MNNIYSNAATNGVQVSLNPSKELFDIWKVHLVRSDEARKELERQHKEELGLRLPLNREKFLHKN